MNKLSESEDTPEHIILQNADLRLTVSSVPDPAALDLLKRTIYGTTGIRYQHTNQLTKAKDLKDPLFFQLWRSGQLVGLYCLDRRMTDLSTEPVLGFYGRYLTVDQAHAEQGYGRLLKQQAIAYVEETTSSPFLFYSYIEGKNARSVNISEKEGFASITRLNTYFFRRLWPQKDKRVEPATAAQLEQIQILLSRYYAKYSLKSFANIGYQGNYFVLAESGQIVAGIQANPVCWRIMQMPSKWGDLFISVAPHVPLVRRLFNPDEFAFAALEGLYLAKGREDLLPVLLESVLAQTGLYSAMWQIDERDPNMTLLETLDMGIMSRFEAGVKTHVFVKAVGLPKGWMGANNPVYTSSFDYS
jgi:GNAT superfamily N-acetyltransferase